MVAAAKLRRAKEAAENARPFAEAMERMLANVSGASQGGGGVLLSGTGKQESYLLIVATADRGLCGGFNSSIARSAKKRIRELQGAGKKVKLLYVGRKGQEQLASEFRTLAVGKVDVNSKKISYSEAEKVSSEVLARVNAGEFDVVEIVYNHFKSAISQVVTWQQLVPLSVGANDNTPANSTPYEYEPSQEAILETLLPKNLGMQIYKALLENAASEQGARMTAMDNATRNAGDMIKKLNLKYNRTRQAAITKELIEIISGAEAV